MRKGAAQRPPGARRRALLAGTLLALGACATTTQLEPPRGKGFAGVVEIYRGTSGRKALALATDDRGRSAWGFFQALTEGKAVAGAMKECAANASRAGVAARCYLFAVGDAQSEETLRGCASGNVPAPRCTMQQRYGF